MTTAELKELLGRCVEAVRLNQRAATPDVLDDAAALVRAVRSNTRLLAGLAALLNKDPNSALSLLGAAEEFIALERVLTEPETADHVVEVLRRVADSPLALRVLVTLL